VQNSRATSIMVKTERLIQVLRYYYPCPSAKRRQTAPNRAAERDNSDRSVQKTAGPRRRRPWDYRDRLSYCSSVPSDPFVVVDRERALVGETISNIAAVVPATVTIARPVESTTYVPATGAPVWTPLGPLLW
jgi:hypothetical protein